MYEIYFKAANSIPQKLRNSIRNSDLIFLCFLVKTETLRSLWYQRYIDLKGWRTKNKHGRRGFYDLLRRSRDRTTSKGKLSVSSLGTLSETFTL